MAKTKLTDRQSEAAILRRNLECIQGRRTNEEMGRLIGKSGVTYAARLRDPETLTIREIKMLCSYFRIDTAKFITDILL